MATAKKQAPSAKDTKDKSVSSEEKMQNASGSSSTVSAEKNRDKTSRAFPSRRVWPD